MSDDVIPVADGLRLVANEGRSVSDDVMRLPRNTAGMSRSETDPSPPRSTLMHLGVLNGSTRDSCAVRGF